jgi:hypothetical protein
MPVALAVTLLKYNPVAPNSAKVGGVTGEPVSTLRYSSHVNELESPVSGIPVTAEYAGKLNGRGKEVIDS